MSTLELKEQAAPSTVVNGDRAQGENKTILTTLLASTGGSGEIFCHFLQEGHELPVTWKDMRDGSRRYAAFFQKHGVRTGEVVLIILRHSPELFYAFLGAMRLGAIPSFMPCATSKQDPEHYWASHRKLFERIGGGTLLTYPENIPQAKDQATGLPWRVIDPVSANEINPDDFSDPEISSAQIAFLQHSSGTTGLKKGVALSHRAVVRQVESYAAALELNDDDRVVSWLPLYHDMGLIACFLLPLITRTPVVMVDPFEWVVNSGLLFAAINRHKATLCWQPNFAFHHLCRTVRLAGTPDLSSMRAWIDCSEPCRAETFQLFEKKFGAVGVRRESLHVCYAMAETVFAISQTPIRESNPTLAVDPAALRENCVVCASDNDPHQVLLSAGKPITGFQVRILNEQGQLVAEDQVGEISVTGDCLFDGYFNLPAETQKKIREGWYQTGDLGFLHHGELYITGRKNDLIIVHGKNFYAHELEYLINQLPGVHPGRNVATGWFRPEVGSEEIIVLAETGLSDDTARAELSTQIKQALLDQTGLLVFDVHLVGAGWLIKTTSGKLSRADNLAKYLAERTAA